MRNIILFFFILFVNYVFGYSQEISYSTLSIDSSSAKDGTETICSLFGDKEGQDCIAFADELLELYKNKVDSAYIHILRHKAWAQNRSGISCVETLQKGIDLYEKQKIQDSQLISFYRNYLIVARTSHPNYKRNLSSFAKYAEKNYEFYNFFYEEIMPDLYYLEENYANSEYITELLSSLGNTQLEGVDAIVLFLQSQIFSLYNVGQVTFKKASANRGTILCQAYDKMKFVENTESDYHLSHLYFNLLDELCDFYYNRSEYLTAAFFANKKLEISKKNWKKWKKWGFLDPWTGKKTVNSVYSNCQLPLLEDYINILIESNNYKQILLALENVKNSEEWQSLGDYDQFYVLSEIERFSSMRSDSDLQKYSLYGDYFHEQKIKQGQPFYYELDMLLKNDTSDRKIYDYYKENKLEFDVVCNQLLDYNRHTLMRKILYEEAEKCFYNGWGFDAGANGFSFEQYLESGNANKEVLKRLIIGERGGYHASLGMMGGDPFYKITTYLARSYAAEKQYEKAIRAQYLTVEIVRTDRPHPDMFTDYETNDFDTLSYMNSKDEIRSAFTTLNVVPYSMSWTFSDEIKSYLFMSDLYYKIADYDKQYEYLNIAFKLANLLVTQDFGVNSDSHAKFVWKKNVYVYKHILSQLPICINKNPKMAELMYSAAYMLNGFMLNHKNVGVQETITSKDDRRIEIMKRTSGYRRQVETELNRSSEIDLYTLKNYEDGLYELNQEFSNKKALQETIIDYSFIKSNLKEDEIFVNFFALTNDSVYVYKLPNGNGYCAEEEKTIFAIITRKDWEYPKVIRIGKDHGSEMVNEVRYLEQNSNSEYIKRMGELHNDINFGLYIWDRIITAAGIKENEKILFIPAGILHSFSVENLPVKEGKRVSELYKVMRLSSAFELQNRGTKYNEGDNLALIGNLSYDGSITNTVSPSSRIRKKASSEVLINRGVLGNAKGDYEETKAIEEIFGEQCQSYTQLKGTKNCITQMDWNSPEYLHISTHGFNYNDSKLNKDEWNVLFGKRDSLYIESERSMYETGLFLSKTDTQSLEDGIINAEEISLLNLHRTKLVVLSACSSSTGISQNNEVFGLWRGFKIAGAKTIIGALWDVDSVATSLLMKSFYSYLKKGYDAYTSLRLAQNTIQEYEEDNDFNIGSNKIYANPFYWAGFVIIDGL